MSMPGSDLSQPASVTVPSRRSANTTVSTESAMTSRETSEARMPSWPIEMPSDTEMVPNSIGKPPACRTPVLAALASRSSDRLQGVISFHDDATPICGLSTSSSVMPTARSIARAGARRSPCGDVVAARLAWSAHGPRIGESMAPVGALSPARRPSGDGASGPSGSRCCRCWCCCSAACRSRRRRPGSTACVLVPVACAVWVLRARVVVAPVGVEVCNGLAAHRLPWSSVEGFEVPRRGPVRLLRSGGRRCP